MNMKTIIITIVVFVLALLGYDWLFLPAWSVHSVGFWLMFFVCALVSLGVVSVMYGANEGKNKKRKKITENPQKKACEKCMKILVGICGAAFLIIVIGKIVSAPLFHVNTYKSLISIENTTFDEAIDEESSISNIAIMDTDSAVIIGNRALGSLTEYVSQYEVSENYSTISYNEGPLKVAPLEYAGIVATINNKDTGIPGYVAVDPVKNTAKYVELEQPIRYDPSGIFENDLMRHIRLSYKSDIIYDTYFEIDDEGNPYWVCPVVKCKAGLFGAKTIDSVICVDACTGDMVKYAAGDVPEWIDRVYDGDLLQGYYDYYGELQSGFWNSIFGKKGCTVTTDDYGYKIIGNDVWVYTGITSLGGDESNVGFVLMNQRTAATMYFDCAGAEEHSAMAAAQGEVQDLGYTAAFPSIINVGGVPTYLMCLKDDAGLVKMYALVNIQQYNLVGTGSTQADALKSYRQLLAANDIELSQSSQTELERDITIERITFAAVQDETYVYINASDRTCYRMKFEDDESLILLMEGDEITVKYLDSGETSIYDMTGYEFR